MFNVFLATPHYSEYFSVEQVNSQTVARDKSTVKGWDIIYSWVHMSIAVRYVNRMNTICRCFVCVPTGRAEHIDENFT